MKIFLGFNSTFGIHKPAVSGENGLNPGWMNAELIFARTLKAKSYFSSNLTGTWTQVSMGSDPRRAGSKRHPCTAVDAL